MYCELADLDEWVVLNESVMMADCKGRRFSVSKLSVESCAARSVSSKNRETYVYEIISRVRSGPGVATPSSLRTLPVNRDPGIISH